MTAIRPSVARGYALPQAERPGYPALPQQLTPAQRLLSLQRLAAARRASVKASWTSAPVNPIGPPPVGGGYPHPIPTPSRSPVRVLPYSSWRSAYLVYGWLGYGLPGFGAASEDDFASGDSPVYGEGPREADYEGAPPEPSLDYADDPNDYPTQARSPYERETSPAAMESGRPVVTLLYKDGRPEERIQNYALTRTTLFVLDGRSSREIALDELDLPRTEEANRDAGVPFDLPAAE
jgi:hypothetical protein